MSCSKSARDARGDPYTKIILLNASKKVPSESNYKVVKGCCLVVNSSSIWRQGGCKISNHTYSICCSTSHFELDVISSHVSPRINSLIDPKLLNIKPHSERHDVKSIVGVSLVCCLAKRVIVHVIELDPKRSVGLMGSFLEIWGDPCEVKSRVKVECGIHEVFSIGRGCMSRNIICYIGISEVNVNPGVWKLGSDQRVANCQ